MGKRLFGKNFFTIEKKGRVFWLADPAGRRMFYTSVQCVAPRHGSRVPGAPSYDGIAACGGSLPGWIAQTEKRLRDWGFRGLGAWNHRLWNYRAVPYSHSLNIFKSVKGPVFSSGWEERLERFVAPQVREARSAPALIGYFLDNEIKWDPGFIYEYFDGRPRHDPNRRAVVDFLRRRHGSVAGLNRAWGTRIGSFAALAGMRKLPAPRDRAQDDMRGFLGVVARRFFTTACRAVRRHDPNRLILGVRYAGLPNREVVAAQRGATDVVSMNLYIQEGEFPAAGALEAHRASGGQPVWVTEFAWHAPYDNRSGDRNRIGFGSRVRYQRSRGLGYERFVSGAASLPFVVGCDWFQWCDESPRGRGDGEDVNFGLVDIRNRPYEDLVSRIRRTNRRVDRLHARSGAWRPGTPPAREVPVCAVPRLGAAASHRDGAALPGLRFRPSLDPLPRRVPVSARVGWRPEGLRFVVAVRDGKRTVDLRKLMNSIEWFWMTDVVEILLRSGREDRPALDAAAVKVWAVPDGRARGRPFVGAYLRHRRVPGGKAGIRVRQRRRRGGYALELLLPARLFRRGRLQPWQVLRANLLVEDAEKVQEVCWSATGGEWTTERPATWGRLVLVP